jgi:hypothetical protein
MAIALHHSRAQGSARLVLIGIANHEGDGGAWPSVATLAKYAGITARNVQKAITKLEELGEIKRHQQQGGTPTMPDHERPNLYRFTLRCPHGCDGTSRHKVGSGLSFHPLSPATPPVASDTPPPVASDTRTILKPSTSKRERSGSSTGARCKDGHPIIIEGRWCKYSHLASEQVS